MLYTCSCCQHVEYRELIGGNAYYCTAHNDYMYPGSTQCEDFELKPRLLEHNQDKEAENMNELCFTYIGTPSEIQHKIEEFLKEHTDSEVVGRTQQNYMSLIDTAYITYHKRGGNENG